MWSFAAFSFTLGSMEHAEHDFLDVDSCAVHAGREDLAGLGVHALPIDLSTTNPLPDIEHGGDSYEALATGHRPIDGGSHVYARLWNPTVARFESALAQLEGTDEAVAFSSGMAAMTAAILAFTRDAKHIIAVRPLYGGTDHLLDSGLLGVETTFCSEDEVGDNVRPDTGMVVIESPGNPSLELVDIASVARQAGSVPVVVDNTFATPLLQNPVSLGAAMSLHSATKYLGGHGDVIGGVIACSSERAEALRRVRAITGALLHPLGAYLLHRGLATLPIRMRAQQATAVRVADWLAEHPAVERVYFPGRDGDPRGLLTTQMRGTGAMISITMRGGYDAAVALTSGVRMFSHAVSLGGVESLLQHPAALTHRPVAGEAKPDRALVRLSIGLEGYDDIVADLGQALDAIQLAAIPLDVAGTV